VERMSTPPNMPLGVFEEYTKHFSLDPLDSHQRAMADWFFEGFFRTKTEAELEMERKQEPLASADFILRDGARRRYAPTVLPRKRYHSIARGPEGDDGGTLSREMLAYRSPRSDSAPDVWDCATLQQNDLPASLQAAYPGPGPMMLIVALNGPKAEVPALPGFTPGEARITVAELPYRLERTRIEAVLDLRQPKAQRWFSDFFLERWGYGLARSADDRRSRTFVEMLPVLMDPKTGGNEVTWAIGEWLVLRGVNALLYPSARSNAAVYLEHGELSSASGWCLVDFRGVEFGAMVKSCG
jgi:hypothetical protein